MSRIYGSAHAAVAAAFLLAGLLFGTWAARIPALKTRLDLTDGELAIVFLALNGGALLGLHAGAWLVSRLGSRSTLRLALPTFAGLLVPLAATPDLPAMLAATIAFALVSSVVDVAINANAVTVERRHGHVVLSRMHAMLTLGGIVGAAGSALAATLGPDVVAHLAVVATVTVACALVLVRWLVTEDTTPAVVADAQKVPTKPKVPMKWFAILAFCVTLAEGSGNDWAATYLHHVGASDALAAVAVAGFLAAMTLGRLAGDHLLARVGPVVLFRNAAVVAAVGFGVALALDHPLAGLAAFTLLGLGLSVTLPILLSVVSHRAADAGRSPAGAVARVSAIAYLGSFVGPAVIGALTTRVALGVALLVPTAAVAVAAGAARMMRGQPDE